MLHDGDLVELHFHGTLDDGTVFDTSRDRRARVFVIGRGQLIPAFEDALCQLSPGDRRTIRLESPDAYGDPDPDLVYDVPTADLPDPPALGAFVVMTGGRPAEITAIGADTVTIDANHPLAGRALNFEVELLSSKPATGPTP